MSRTEQISAWIDQGANLRNRLSQAMAARGSLQAMPWLDDDARKGKAARDNHTSAMRSTPALRGSTITGGPDEERQRAWSVTAGKGRASPSGPALGSSRSQGAGGHTGRAGGAASSDASITAGSAGTVGRAKLLAAGYQPAVVKVVSYARGAARATATGQYIQREDVPLETHDGRMLANREAVAEEIGAWAKTFSKRVESRDVAEIRMTLNGVADTPDGRALYGRVIAAAFTGHRHAWHVQASESEGGPSRCEARIVLAMAGSGRERFRVRDELVESNDGDPMGKTIARARFERISQNLISARIAEATDIPAEAISLWPDGTSHGREGVIYRLNRLNAKGPARDDRGQLIANPADVKKAAREWGRSLRSQSARDTMHLILSAKAGTNSEALTRAARNFLQDRFADHKFMFGLHTDKEADGHIHVHAVIAVKSESGRKIHPGRDTFDDWRKAYAEHAQAEGLKIVATAARERASSQSYGAKDKAIVEAAERPRPKREAQDKAYAADPANQAIISKARQRIARARANPIRLPVTEQDQQVMTASHRVWDTLAKEQPDNAAVKIMQERLELAHNTGAILHIIAKRVGHLTQENRDMAITSEQMVRDLRLMNEAVSQTSDLLSGDTKQQFQQISARYLETLANRIDLQRLQERGIQQMTRADAEALAGRNADKLIAEALQIQQGGTRKTIEAAKAEQPTREARTSSETAGSTAGDGINTKMQNAAKLKDAADNQTDALARLREEQERIISEFEAGESQRALSHKGQRIKS